MVIHSTIFAFLLSVHGVAASIDDISPSGIDALKKNLRERVQRPPPQGQNEEAPRKLLNLVELLSGGGVVEDVDDDTFPTVTPTDEPSTWMPTEFPTVTPTDEPSTWMPTEFPTVSPTDEPSTWMPTEFPTLAPTTESPTIIEQTERAILTNSPTLPTSGTRYFDSGNSSFKTVRYNIIGINNYNNNPTNRPIVVVLVSDNDDMWFLGFNNVMVTVTKVTDSKVYSLEASLGEGESVSFPNWRETGQDLVVQVHDLYLNERPKYADVEITFGYISFGMIPGLGLGFGDMTTQSGSSETNGETIREINEPPSKEPTKVPTLAPTNVPTVSPTSGPTTSPTTSPTNSPTTSPTKRCGNNICELDETPATCSLDCTLRNFFTTQMPEKESSGHMFAIAAKADTAPSGIRIKSFQVISKKGGKDECQIWTRSGNFVGFEEDSTGWEMIYYAKDLELAKFYPTNLPISPPIHVEPKRKQSFHVYCKKSIMYTESMNEGQFNKGGKNKNEVVEESVVQPVPYDRDERIIFFEGITLKNVFNKPESIGQFSGGISYIASKSLGENV